MVSTPVDGIDPTLRAGVAGSVGGDAGAGPVATRTDQPAIPDEEDEEVAAVDVNAEQQAELARRTREQIAAQAAEDAARAQEKAAAAPTVGTGDIAEEVAAAVVAK